MDKEDLRKLINLEVQKELNKIVPKLVKPLVQEAVAGALANLLAEGIVKGKPTSEVIEVNFGVKKPVGKTIEKASVKRSMSPADRKRIMEQYAEGVQPIGESTTISTGNSMLDGILNETAHQMTVEGGAPSILDTMNDEDASPEAIEILSKDYTELMKRVNKKR